MPLEYITLCAYFLLLLVLGTVFARFNRNLSDFARGGAQLTWWMAGSSMLMAGISAFTFTGNASAAFEAGPSLLVIYVANVLGFVVGACWLGPWYRQTRALTAADVIRGRFGAPAEQFSAYIGLIIGPFGAAVQLWALGLFVAATFGFPLTATIVTVGVITVLYSASGGAWAVAATDFVQAVILFGITLLVGVLAWQAIGGAEGLLAHARDPENAGFFAFIKPSGAFPAERYTWDWAAIIFVMQMVGQLNLGTATRYLGVKDGREASRAAWLAAGLMTIGSFVWFLPPVVARLLFEGEVMASGVSNPSTTAYAVAARELLPNGLLGVMIAAMFAATMSSMDSGLNAQTSTVVRNILPRLLAVFKLSLPDERAQLRWCRMISLALGATIILISLGLAQQERVVLFDAFLTLSSVLGVPLTLPLLAGLFIRRLPAWSYFTIFAVAMIPSVWSLIDERIAGTAWTVQARALAVLTWGGLAMLACVTLRHRTSRAQYEREDAFFRVMRTPVDFAREVGVSRDAVQAVLLGRSTTAVGLLLCLFCLVPNSTLSRVYILLLGGGVAAVGLLLWRHGRRKC